MFIGKKKGCNNGKLRMENGELGQGTGKQEG